MDGSVEDSISNYRHDQVVTGRIDVVSGPTGRRRWPDELMEARDERRLQRLQKQLVGHKLLILDELGFVPL